eukprot:INCI9962.1.p1 GENE.INCI9962.1~~INCI9962.1.p1  ORF type:complete len:379 (+),score=86.23 INCI9962.1:97-1233(+)
MTSSATAGTQNAADSHNMEAKGSDPLPLSTLDDLLANNCSSTYDFGPASASFEDENEFLEAGFQQQQQQQQQQEPLPTETKTAEATGTLDDLLAFNCSTAYDFGPASASFDDEEEEYVEAGCAEVEAARSDSQKKHGETGTAGQVAGEAEARKSKEAEQQAILECGFGYFDDIAEAPHDNRSNPIDGLFELEEDDEDDEDEEEEDLLANMTPISGLENLSESIVVRGVRYHPQGKPRARSSGTEKKRQTHNRNENLSCETSESPPQTRHSRHRSQGAAPTPAEVRRNKARARKLATMSHSPVSRSRPIPIPDSPVLRGKLLKSKSFNGGLDMGINDFAIGGGRAVDFDFDVHGHAQGFHDFGNSYRDHGQGFAFNMSL